MEVETMDPAQEFEAKLLARLKPLNEVTARGTSAVQQFYSGATVFLTGGSGFLGKQLIDKLFRATKISKIFLLLRCKKGKPIEQRLTEMLQDPLYDMLREQQPDFAEKLVLVSGDVAELRLGLSEEDWNTIAEQVDIVFHLAATTRFDDTLRAAILTNTRGTREALTLGKACKKLRSYVHVSTAYSHATVDRINADVSEIFYKSPMNPNTIIQMVETLDEGKINDITESLISNWPNTYTFAKSIAEELVNTMGNDMPICVVRPAIVISSICEPVPGWLDMSCLYGVSGLGIAICLGVVHAAKINNHVPIDFIPVDYVNNAIIAAGWETAKKRANDENKTKIYVVSPSTRNPASWRELYTILSRDCRKYPSPMIVGHGYVWCTRHTALFWIYSWLLHLIPAYIIDGISVIIGNKRSLISNWPNTYTFAKSIAEELVSNSTNQLFGDRFCECVRVTAHRGSDLPICVVRPAIIICSKREPNPGWLDMSCIYGASGLGIAICLGVVHAAKMNNDVPVDFVPVDYVNNAIIAAGWETAKKRANDKTKTKIYVVSPSSRNPAKWRELYTILSRDCRKYPSPMILVHGFLWSTRHTALFWIYSWLLHLIPAYIIDEISVMLGNKRRFVKLATKMYKMTLVLSYFICNQWNFDDQNTAALFDSLSEEDREIFNFDIKNIDWKETIITWCNGGRKYILKDGLTGTIYARKKATVLKILTYILLPLYFYCLFKILYFALSLFTLFW